MNSSLNPDNKYRLGDWRCGEVILAKKQQYCQNGKYRLVIKSQKTFKNLSKFCGTHK